MSILTIKQAIIGLIIIALIINLYNGMYLSCCILIIASVLASNYLGEIDKKELQNYDLDEDIPPPNSGEYDDQPVSIKEDDIEDLPKVEPLKVHTKLPSALDINFIAEAVIEIDENINKFARPEKAIRHFVNRMTDELIENPSIELLEGKSTYLRARHKLLPVDLEQPEGVPVRIVRNGILLNEKIILRADVEIIE